MTEDQNPAHETFTRWDDLSPFAEEWDSLCGRTGGDVFGSFDWARTWWEFYGGNRNLKAVLLRSGPRLAASLRLFTETQYLGLLPLRLIRVTGCDHGLSAAGLAIDQGSEDAAVSAISSEFGAGWDLLHLGPFRPTAGISPSLIAALEKQFPSHRVALNDAVSPYVFFSLPATYDEFLATLGKSHRYEMLRQQKLLAKKYRVEHVVRETADDILAAFPSFLESHERLWRAKSLPGYFNEWPRAKEFHRKIIERLAPSRRVFLTELLVDGLPVTRQYCFRFGDIIHWFQPTREDSPEWRKAGVGNLGFLHLVEYAIATGAKTIDGGGRPIDYKLKLGGRVVHSQLLTVTSCRASARLSTFRAASWLFEKAYASLWHRRLSPLLRVSPRPYLESYIRSRLPLP